jgi:transposase
MNTDKYVGLDVHKDTTVVAVAEGGREGECRIYGTISSDLHALEKLLRKLGGEKVCLHVVYEAGPTGYVIYRRLHQLKIDCIVVAPSRTPQPAGQRQKTDRRDALMLARLHRAGELTGIHVPDAVDESIRDLTRARADAVHDLTRAKQRLKSFLLRQGYRYSGKANWSEAHQRYLRELVMPLPALKAVLEEYLLAISQRLAAVERLDELIAAQVPQWRMYPAVQALMCLRGVQLNAATVICSNHDSS